jgi:hypothetical protein
MQPGGIVHHGSSSTTRPPDPGGAVGGGDAGRAGDGHNGKIPIKMNFPKFDGEFPRIWRDKCLDYFWVCNIHPTMWLTAATMHLEGNAAHWFQAYKLKHVVQGWPNFITAVEAKFGVHDHRQFMSELLSLKQTGTVDEYCSKFQELVYKISSHNPYYDDTFLVSQFLKGLKAEIRLPVASQIPETLDRAMLLAHVQHDLQSQHKPWMPRQGHIPKPKPVLPRQELPRPAIKLANNELWKDRQLRDYRRANHLCFRCGEKFTPQHQCAQKGELHVLAAEDHQTELSDEVLELLELQDIANAQELSLSINALSGSLGDGTIRIRARVQNQVMLLLVDSGSSHTFINSNFVERLQCPTTLIPAVDVKIANGEQLQCDQVVPQLAWWAQGHSFVTDMRVLPLGAYDAILGVDWLKQWGDMRCN